mgnify:CR=1 FL=1
MIRKRSQLYLVILLHVIIVERGKVADGESNLEKTMKKYSMGKLILTQSMKERDGVDVLYEKATS